MKHNSNKPIWTNSPQSYLKSGENVAQIGIERRKMSVDSANITNRLNKLEDNSNKDSLNESHHGKSIMVELQQRQLE